MLEIGSQLPVQAPDGSDVGTFVVRGLRARGGQGIVYVLRGPTGKPAVLKVPSPKGLFGSEIELRILKSLPVHQNIVKLIGTTSLGGVECAVMTWAHQNPYLRLNAPYMRDSTKTYRGVAPRTPLPATTALEMVQEVLAALEHLHRFGFVHGDIKPANISISVASNRTRLSNVEYFARVQQRGFKTILADFGSTRSISFLAEKSKTDELLAPAEFTPVFAPPEVFVKEAVHSGQKVDVYQVGLLLYQLVSGHLPYDQHLPMVARRGLTAELVELKRAEAKGRIRAYDSARLRAARQQDVVFAEAFAAQQTRDRFYDDVEAIIDLATTPKPQARPSVTALRSEVFRLFELEPPSRSMVKRPQVTVWNPRWHLTRSNRLSAAARVPDPDKRATKRFLAQSIGSEDDTEPVSMTGLTTGSIDAEFPSAAMPASVVAAQVGAPTEEEIWSEPPEELDPPAEVVDPDAQAPGSERYRKIQPPDPGEDPRAPLEGLKIAVVDDDRVALAVIGRSLRKRGCQVQVFQDPEVGLETICRDLPHAAVIDLQMPVISGLDLVRFITRRLRGMPFPMVILSSVEEEAALKEAFRYGVRDYLIKPVTEAELAVKLEKAIREHRESQPPGVPRELGGFELLEELRRGEFAVIYRAADVWDRYPDVVKAVKVLRPDVAGQAEPLLRLRREVDLIAACNHQGLVRLRESGLVGPLLYYVADEIPARSLGKEVREAGTFGVKGVQLLLAHVLDTLSYLHDRSILIGDLSPESLARAENGQILITELGSARHLGEPLRMDEPAPSRSRYTAPELFEDPQEATTGADLYALAISALEIYSGKAVVRSRSSLSVDVGQYATGLPRELVSLLARMLDPIPSDRLQSAKEAARELARVVTR